MTDFPSKVLSYANRYGMFDAPHIIACVSGGADSIALLYSLREIRKISRGTSFTLSAAHFDHRLRGRESDSDREFVIGVCETLGVKCDIGFGNTNKYAEEHKISIEDAARRLRYDFFAEVSEKYAGSKVATAHNADDNLETMLLNLARGSGAAGLSGIPRTRGNIIRPLLFATRSEIIEYLEENAIAHVEDSTNSDIRIRRNKIRHIVVPSLKEINERASEHALSASDLIAADDAYLSAAARREIESRSTSKGFPVRVLNSLEYPIASRVLILLAGVKLTAAGIADILEICAKDSGGLNLDLPGVLVKKEKGYLKFCQPNPPRRPKID